MKIQDESIPEALDQFNLRIPHTLKKEIKKIAAREEREMTDILIEQLQNYVKVHGEGNPVYALDKWQEPNFKMTPAFGESMVSKWNPFLDKCSKDELNEIIDKADFIAKKARERAYARL